MRVAVICTNYTLTVDDMPDEDVMALSEEFETGENPVLMVSTDGTGFVKLARQHIVAVDVQEN